MASLSKIAPDQPIGEGERLFRLTAKNALTNALFKRLENTVFLWDNAVIPVLEKMVSGKDYKVTLARTNFVLVVGKPIFRTRKWFDPKTQSLNFWATIKKAA